MGQEYSIQGNDANIRTGASIAQGFNEASEEMMKVPDKIDSLIQGKFYYSACKTLLSSMRILHGPDCASIGALENIRQRLNDWKTVR